MILFVLRKKYLSFLRKQKSILFNVDPCFCRGDIGDFGVPEQKPI